MKRGFTIVELLIVVVVIAILATITIVSYNGISNRAKASSAQSAASQANKKIRAYAIENAETYPASLSAINISNNDNISYQYRVDTTSTPQTYCVTATVSDISYYVSNTATSPATGACPGHGANGVSPIRNLAFDPRATDNIILSGPGWRNNRWFGNSGSSGTYQLVTGASDGPVGLPTYARKTWTALTSGGGDFGYDNNVFNAEPGKIYTVSSYLRSSVLISGSVRVQVVWRDAGNANIGTAESGAMTSLQAGVWRRIFLTTGEAPAGTARAHVVSDIDQLAGIAVGMILDGTGLMITEGPTLHNYADGNSPGWAWSGMPNNSPSSGPAL